ncbi:Transcription initiation factor TFIID subunit 13 [Picochlorum sp. SENEW3]|nr:Transcription initiation factor TFIID subunit 13 [Picochlorum sp. SENEW3]
MSGRDVTTGTTTKRQRADGEGGSAPATSTSLRGTFIRDLIPMMFGFGDDESPLVETADALEELVIAYASGVLQESLDLASRRGRVKSNGKPLGPPTAEDVMTVVRRDGKKSNRVEELLIMQREIKVIQEMEKTDEESLAKLVQ